MTYSCPAWEFAADSQLLKLQRLQNKVLHTTGKFAKCTQYIYDYIMKLCIQQEEVVQNHEKANVRDIGIGEARHRKYNRLKLRGGQA
jgi:hypothetical protein